MRGPPPKREAGLFRDLGVLGVAAVRLSRDTFELPRRLLDLHEVPCALIALLKHSIGSFELGTTGNSAATKSVASILSHALSSFSRAAAKQTHTYHRDRRNQEVSW